MGKAQKPAAEALAKLAHDNPQIQASISEDGGIAPLLALLNGLDIDAQVSAAAALSEMARDNVDTQAAIAKAGGIGPLLALLSSRSGAAQSQGMGALAQVFCHLVSGHRVCSSPSHCLPFLPRNDCNLYAVQLACNNTENQDAIARMGGIKPLVSLLDSNSQDVAANAASALMEISRCVLPHCIILPTILYLAALRYSTRRSTPRSP